MIDRREFGITGLSAVALAALPGTALVQAKTPEKGAAPHEGHDDMLRACAKACSDCQRECESCASHCAQQLSAGKKEHLITLMTCRDCAALCAAAAQIVAAGGPFAGIACEACTAACAECAKACAKFPDDKHMQVCADECRKCEQACRSMLKHTGGK